MKTPEQTIRDVAFPNGVSDEKWNEFKYAHSGVNWVGFAIKAMEEYRSQTSGAKSPSVKDIEVYEKMAIELWKTGIVTFKDAISHALTAQASDHAHEMEAFARKQMMDFTPLVYELFNQLPLEHSQHGIACEKFAAIRNKFLNKNL